MCINRYILLISVMFYTTHGEYLEKRRNFYSAQFGPEKSIDYKLRFMGVINPLAISHFLSRPPEHECNVTFWNGKVLRTGHIVSSDDLSQPPTAIWPTQENHYYTLYLADLDGKLHLGTRHPNYTKFQANCHWLVSNIPSCDINQGTTLFSYKIAGKGPSRELRRYLIVVYDQHHPEPLDFDGGFIAEQEDRQDFRVDKFAEFYHFEHPYAANMFLVLDNEDYKD